MNVKVFLNDKYKNQCHLFMHYQICTGQPKYLTGTALDNKNISKKTHQIKQNNDRAL